MTTTLMVHIGLESDGYNFLMSKPNNQKELPEGFAPSEFDVICGWARQNYHHAGNRRLRNIISENVPRYTAAKTKTEKGQIIADIVSGLKRESPSGTGFVKMNPKTGRWLFIGTEKVKDKIGHALRKASFAAAKKAKKAAGKGKSGAPLQSDASSVSCDSMDNDDMGDGTNQSRMAQPDSKTRKKTSNGQQGSNSQHAKGAMLGGGGPEKNDNILAQQQQQQSYTSSSLRKNVDRKLPASAARGVQQSNIDVAMFPHPAHHPGEWEALRQAPAPSAPLGRLEFSPSVSGNTLSPHAAASYYGIGGTTRSGTTQNHETAGGGGGASVVPTDMAAAPTTTTRDLAGGGGPPPDLTSLPTTPIDRNIFLDHSRVEMHIRTPDINFPAGFLLEPSPIKNNDSTRTPGGGSPESLTDADAAANGGDDGRTSNNNNAPPFFADFTSYLHRSPTHHHAPPPPPYFYPYPPPPPPPFAHHYYLSAAAAAAAAAANSIPGMMQQHIQTPSAYSPPTTTTDVAPPPSSTDHGNDGGRTNYNPTSQYFTNSTSYPPAYPPTPGAVRRLARRNRSNSEISHEERGGEQGTIGGILPSSFFGNGNNSHY